MSKIDTVTTDVLIIGGGPSGLATSIHLADILKDRGRNERILLIEKGRAIGSHILSGAVIKPSVCKELWSVPEGNIGAGEIYHTMGYPLDNDEFGGGFIYGLKDNKVAVGLVIGLDYQDPTFDVHDALQIWKTSAFVSKILKGGKLVEYGAKTLPEGGLYAIPKLFVDNALIVGDSAGLVAMPALKGIHLAIRSGMLAAQATAELNNDTSEKSLQQYETLVNNSAI